MSHSTRQSALQIGRLRKHRTCFSVALHDEVPAGQIPHVLDDMEASFRALLLRLPDIGGSRNLLTENLLVSAWFLAFIKTLAARGLSDAALARATERAAAEIVNRRSRLGARVQAWLVQNRLFQVVLERMALRTHQGKASDGFVVTFVPGDGRTFDFGYDVSKCAIVALFAAEGAARHAPLMCKVDYLTSAMAGLRLERKGTIAEGRPLCDFRFVRKGVIRE